MKKSIVLILMALFLASTTVSCAVFVKRTGNPTKIDEKKDNGQHKGQIEQVK